MRVGSHREREAIDPHIFATFILGRDFRVTQHRGEFVESALAPFVMATVHPSSILRAPDDETCHEEMRRFVADLKKLSRVLSRFRDR